MHFRNHFFPPSSKLVILLTNWFYIMRGFENNSAFLIQVFFFFFPVLYWENQREQLYFVPSFSPLCGCSIEFSTLPYSLAFKIFYKNKKNPQPLFRGIFFFSFHFPICGLWSLGPLSLSQLGFLKQPGDNRGRILLVCLAQCGQKPRYPAYRTRTGAVEWFGGCYNTLVIPPFFSLSLLDSRRYNIGKA